MIMTVESVLQPRAEKGPICGQYRCGCLRIPPTRAQYLIRSFSDVIVLTHIGRYTDQRYQRLSNMGGAFGESLS